MIVAGKKKEKKHGNLRHTPRGSGGKEAGGTPAGIHDRRGAWQNGYSRFRFGIPQDTRSFRVAAENKLHIPARLDLGAALFWMLGVQGWGWGWSAGMIWAGFGLGFGKLG